MQFFFDKISSSLPPHSCYRFFTVISVIILHTCMEAVFECPSRNTQTLAMFVIFIPAIVIFLFTWLLHKDLRNRFRGLLHGCFHARSRPIAWARFNAQDFCFVFIYTMLNACLGPFTWIVLCLLRGTVPSCSHLGQKMGNQSEAGRIALVNVKQWYQILGLEVMLVVSIVFGVSRMVKECIDRTAPYPGLLHNFCFC